jgi:hypothetical protein
MFAALVLSSFLAVAAQSAQAQALQVLPLPRDGQVLVTFRLNQELTDDIRAKIHSGMLVSFIYKVDLRRASAVWFDRTLATAVVKASVRYDSLTRRYTLSRAIDGAINEVKTTDSEDVAWAWLTTEFERLPLFSTVSLESNAEYYVRVAAHATPGNASFVWPWRGSDIVGFMKFTLIR